MTTPELPDGVGLPGGTPPLPGSVPSLPSSSPSGREPSHELRTAQADGEVPLTPEELGRLASQIYAELTPLQVDLPRGPAPGAPSASGNAPSTPDGIAAQPGVSVPAPPVGMTLGGVAPVGVAPVGVVPVAPRGSAPDVTAASSAGRTAGSVATTASPSGLDPAFVPGGIAGLGDGPTSPLGGSDTPPTFTPVAPRGSAGTPFGLLEVPSIPAGPSFLSRPDVPAEPESSGTGIDPARSERVPTEAVLTEPALPSDWPTPNVPGLKLGAVLSPWTPVYERAGQESSPEAFYQLGDHRRSGGLRHSVLQNEVGTVHESFDVAAVRADFPILREEVNGYPLVWFDNAATTQKPRAVIDRLVQFYEHENSNIHRAAHELAARATDAYEDARETVRDFVGAALAEEIIFVRGATEALNLVAQAWGRKNLGPGDEILITHLEHHANIVPWQMLAQQTGAVLKVAPVDDASNLLLDEFTRLLGPRTKLVAATQVANATGTVVPVDVLVQQAHRVGARVLVDGAQSVPHLRVDLRELGADFFAFSGHKIFGPTGIGALYLAERVWDETPAWHGGGNMIADVTIERSLYQGPPNKWEAGTGNIADAVGLAAALRYVREVGIERIAAYEHLLLDYATPRLARVPGVRLIGTADHKASVLSFLLDGHEPEEVGRLLNSRGIAVRAGHHCAQPILRRLGVEKTVRPSFAFYNTTDEIDLLVETVREISEGTLAG